MDFIKGVGLAHSNIGTFAGIKVLKSRGKTKESKKHLGEARKIFKKAGVGRWVEKVDKLTKKR
ncbi:MAG: hypothetical protein E3J87_00690 [Candidatus Cloacimonadota bacterium]|nr:MAG: hypothetical protein E3J87_00690 [Candidatus Cloacimonadota bacterium]